MTARRSVPRDQRPAPGECVFHFGLNDASRPCTHRIVRKTATRIYVESWCKDGANGPVEFFPRQLIEREGVRRIGVLYLYMPANFVSFPAPTPACVAVLGLRETFTASDARAAWRKVARRTHPDAGGSASEFIKAKRAYDEALAIVGAR